MHKAPITQLHGRSEPTFEVLFARNPLPMWVYDLATLRFLEVNLAAVEQYGYSRQEFLAMRISDIRPPDDVPRLERAVTELAGENHFGVRRDKQEWRHRLKNGQIRNVDIVAQLIDFAGCRASLVVATDITALRQTQQHLARYAERLGLLHAVDQALIAGETPLAIAERAISRLRKLLDVPRAIVNLFDLDANEAEWLVGVGRNRVHQGPGVRFSMVFMGDVQSLRRGDLQVLDTATLPPGPEVDALLGSGVHRYMVVPMIANGELIGGLSFGGSPGEFAEEQISIAREVAAQLAIAIAQASLYERVKQQAEELEQRVHERTLELHAANEQLQREILERRRAEAEAARANQLKSEFLANMSHELRTPLNAILGFTELMHDDHITPAMPEYKEFLADILASGSHLLQLINDVLDLSKVEAGKLEFHAEKVDLAVVVAEVLSILRTTVAAKSIRLSSAVDPDLTDIALDAARFKQVLYNYLSNAVKFTPQGGHVEVRAISQAAGGFRLEVEDSGIGIAPEDLARLFIEFQQLDAGTAKQHAGTGLGLALTKRLVEAQGGSVGVHSVLGRGSTFYAIFPCQMTVVPATLTGSSPGPDVRAPVVLVIDHAEGDQALTVRTLAAAGYAVDTALTGAQALAKCQERAFDAITVDLLLPDMDGLQVLQQIRASGLNSNVPVIAITVVTEQGAIAGYAIHDLLKKPLDRGALLASLTRAGVTCNGTGTILVVDDDAGSLRLMRAALAQLQCPSICVQTGSEGLRLAEIAPLRAVILDLVMPEMTGFEFLEHFRRLPQCRDLPVFVWTGKDLTAKEVARLRAAAQGVMSKGIKPNAALIEQLQGLLSPMRPEGMAHER